MQAGKYEWSSAYIKKASAVPQVRQQLGPHLDACVSLLLCLMHECMRSLCAYIRKASAVPQVRQQSKQASEHIRA